MNLLLIVVAFLIVVILLSSNMNDVQSCLSGGAGERIPVTLMLNYESKTIKDLKGDIRIMKDKVFVRYKGGGWISIPRHKHMKNSKDFGTFYTSEKYRVIQFTIFNKPTDRLKYVTYFLTFKDIKNYNKVLKAIEDNKKFKFLYKADEFFLK